MEQEQQAQIEQMMGQIAQMLQAGEDPNTILQQMVEANIPQEQAQQMIQAVMEEIQSGGGQEGVQPETGTPSNQSQQGGGVGSGQEALQILQEAIQVVGPDGLAMILQAWDSLPQQQKQQMIQQLSQMSQEAQSSGKEQAPQDNRSAMLFGE